MSDVQTQTTSLDKETKETQTSEYNASVVCFQPFQLNTIKCIEGNDESTKFYTGLPSWSCFEYLVNFLCTCEPHLVFSHSRLTPTESFLLTLMRLRLNLLIDDLAYRFGIATTTAGDIFNKRLELMHTHMKFMIKWPTQETCRANSSV